jgi:hypothetical protein
MAAIGVTPSGAVIAEYIRDLQHWPGHDGELGRLPLLPRPLFLAAERARNARDPAGGDAGVARRRIELVVAQGPQVIMLTFYVIETEGSAERDRLLADAAGHSARDKRRYPPP